MNPRLGSALVASHRRLAAGHDGNRHAEALGQRGHDEQASVTDPGPPCGAATAGAVRMPGCGCSENAQGLSVIDDHGPAAAADGIEVVTHRRHPAAARAQPVGQHDRAAPGGGGHRPAQRFWIMVPEGTDRRPRAAGPLGAPSGNRVGTSVHEDLPDAERDEQVPERVQRRRGQGGGARADEVGQPGRDRTRLRRGGQGGGNPGGELCPGRHDRAVVP